MSFSQFNHSNWYPEYQPKPDIKPSNKYATWIWLGLVVLIVGPILLYVVSVSVGRKVGCAMTNCRHNPVGQPLSWDEQLAMGQAAALKEDPDGILEHVAAQPFASWPENWTLSDTLKLSFTYELQTMDEFTIEYSDAMENSNPRIYKYKYGGTPLPTEVNMRYDRSQDTIARLATIKVSPREAEIATWTQATTEAKNDKVDIRPDISLSFIPSTSDKHISWGVTYWPIPVDNPPDLFAPLKAFLAGSYSSQFTVDAVTGEVIETDLGPKLPASR